MRSRRRGELLQQPADVERGLGAAGVAAHLFPARAVRRVPELRRVADRIADAGRQVVARPTDGRAAATRQGALLPLLRSIPPDQRAAAATLGASPVRAWLAIDVRQIARPLAAGAGLARQLGRCKPLPAGCSTICPSTNLCRTLDTSV